MINKYVAIIVYMFCLAGCATALQGSKFSAQDKLNYPKASADADRVVTLISNKDNTRFFVDGNAIGSPISAGGDLKILVNGQRHDIIAEAPGYKAKPHHTQPPYDERSPISFSFIYKDKLTDDENPMAVAVISPIVAIQETPAYTDHRSKPQKSAPSSNQASSPEAVKPTSYNTIVLNNNKHERRVALVIGNSAYQYTAQLANPTNDAEDIAQALKKFNFQVILKTNADLETMADAVYQFGESLKGGGIGLFYYSGHGLQVKGENYLLPVDANLMREDDVKRKAISANDVVEKMGEGNSHLNLVFLDACRNNPFPSSTRAVNRGLIGMNAPNGTLLIFSTNPDNVALDGSGRNGTYTKHLLQQIDQPGLEIGMMLRKVRTAVKEETGGQQVPWENGSIEGEFYFTMDSP
ncbi:caspase domain-containing protein [Methylobacter sp. BBA5.1]|uniref:caspase family protein n=1 Tax=Methylobacter sp. BBA5.1 TaxID=1495064 RepID=UPI0013767618|nr:caspase domain-containing protein [Methylobacter sp. BBA5.1]